MKISELKGIGPKTAKIFESSKIFTTDDLICYYPFRYDVIKRSNIEELLDNDKIIIDGLVETRASVFSLIKR